MRRLRQLLCVHWFDEQPTYEYQFSNGPIICTQQKSWTAAMQPRVCSKCGLKEERRVGELVFNGWD